MRMPTSELDGEPLGWAVAQVLGYRVDVTDYGDGEEEVFFNYPARDKEDQIIIPRGTRWKPWCNPSQGWPLIDGYGISVLRRYPGVWDAVIKPEHCSNGTKGVKAERILTGHNSLVAAMRCLVAAFLGNEVDVPDKLERKSA